MNSALVLLLVGLSHSLGWRLRGNWGHEYGAMIPGALSALALCVALPHAWVRQRIAFVGFAGAVGWSFGGSMSYGLLIGKTASSSGAESAYGFAMLGVIGLLWATMGGGAVALALCWPRHRLATFVPPLAWVFLAWLALDLVLRFVPEAAQARLDWSDTDWLGVLVALGAILAYRASLRRQDAATELMLWMALGWWTGVLLLVSALGLHMTPPRGDNWAGCLGMGVAMLAWLHRHGERDALRAAVITGLFGGAGFMAGQAVANMGRAFAPRVEWWGIMEQVFGLVAGIGLALTMRHLVASCGEPREDAAQRVPPWTEGVAVGFLLLGVPWLNISKNPQTIWLRNAVVPERMGPFAIDTWFLIAFVLVAIVVVLAIRDHLRRGLALVPESPLGRAQMLFLGLLWVVVLGNLSRYLPFPPERLASEGLVHVNACLISALAVLAARDATPPAAR